MKSNYPCLIKDNNTGEYAPKGWMHYRREMPWTKDIEKAKVYRNSAGAKNALKGAFNRYYEGPERDIEVVEFHTEFSKRG